jgi:hypothetical protein
MQNLTGGLACVRMICTHHMPLKFEVMQRGVAPNLSSSLPQALTYLAHLFPSPVLVFFFLVTAQNCKVHKLQV